VPLALHLAESVTYPNGTVQLTYDAAGTPTYGDMAVGGDDLQRLADSGKPAGS
jgi:hypothetical protein